VTQGPRDTSGGAFGIPRLDPRLHAALQFGHDAAGDAAVNILPVSSFLSVFIVFVLLLFGLFSRPRRAKIRAHKVSSHQEGGNEGLALLTGNRGRTGLKRQVEKKPVA
jgi:hypothetical protein